MGERIWSADVRAIGDAIATLTPVRASELEHYLDRVHGLKPGLVPVPLVENPVEPTVVILAEPVFDLVLESVDPTRRIAVIKVLRDKLSLGLREARDLVEQSPSLLAKGLQREEAERFQQELQRASGRSRSRNGANKGTRRK